VRYHRADVRVRRLNSTSFADLSADYEGQSRVLRT